MATLQENQEKLQQLYQQYEQPMYRIAYAILHNTEQAEDAVSDSFLKVIRHIDKIAEVESPKTKQFMIQIVRNTAINQYRKNAKEAKRLVGIAEDVLQIPSETNEVEQFLSDIEQKETAEQFLEGLSETDREILRLRCEVELPFREIAQQLSMKECTVRKRFERAKKTIWKQKGGKAHEKKFFIFG
jgi:RNA polymerase sigma-70 factor (ECF subfamily)